MSEVISPLPVRCQVVLMPHISNLGGCIMSLVMSLKGGGYLQPYHDIARDMAEDLDVDSGVSLPELTVKEYVLAGDSIFTIESVRTGQRFTYRVIEGEPTDGSGLGCIHFVKVLTGPVNTRDFSFFGTIFDGEKFRVGRKSLVLRSSPSVVAFAWFFSVIDDLPSTVAFHRSEFCCRCGRTLTTPESIQAGIGPVCASKL